MRPVTRYLLSTRFLHSRAFENNLSDESLLRAIDQCRHPSSLQALKQLQDLLNSRSNLSTNPYVTIKSMRAFSACGQPSIARQLFNESAQRNTLFFNVMIRSYVNNQLFLEALKLFYEMGFQYNVKPDNYTFPCSLKACAESKQLLAGQQIHGSVTKLGLDCNLFVGNALITMYSRCGVCDHALRVFDEIQQKDVVSWNAMIAGFAYNGEFIRAMEVCEKLVGVKRPSPDDGTMASMLLAMENADTSSVGFVRRMFDEMKGKGLVSWNAMIAICANNLMAAEAVELYLKMEKEGVAPDAITFASVLPACGDVSALSLGTRIHRLIKRKSMFPNMVLENALMDMYANCGCLPAAREVFENMQRRDVVSWTSIVTAYGMHGHSKDAIDLFEQMCGLGMKPDSIAFVAVLSACSQSGLLDEGKHYFNCMTNEYQVVPRIEHYACMVDLLGRSGCLEEAYDFIQQMPIEPNERVWGALLGACRVYSNIDMGVIAADCLFKLVPQQSGYYVLLSNIYAKAGRWEDVTAVRKVMTDKGIKKLPGRSNVEHRNKVHTFHIGDTSHPQTNQIYAELKLLIGRMMELGYVAETSSTLHDVEEEDKEGHLSVHSEKLAMVFGIMNIKPPTPIRIRMNLRTCGDCHHAAKLISHITKREIIIKDTNRFHRFKNGLCSCGDYW